MKKSLLILLIILSNYCFGERITFPTINVGERHASPAQAPISHVRATHASPLQTPQNTLFFTNTIEKMELLKTSIQGYDFTHLNLEGYVFHGRVGYPKLPAKTQLIEIPFNTKAEITILASEYMDIPLNERGFSDLLLPVQPPIRKSAIYAPVLAKNQQAYTQNDFTSRDIVDMEILGIMRDRRLAQLNVLPVQYLPSKNVIRVYYFIEFQIAFIEQTCSDSMELSGSLRSPFGRSSTQNREDTAPPQQLYKIISDRKFEQTLKSFVEWKEELGFNVWVSYTDQPEVGNTTTDIRAFLRDIYENGTQKKDYLLLVGSIHEIPAFYTKLPASSDILGFANGTHITDFYYAEYTDDMLPDVYYGRLSATTPQELQNQIEKIIKMESLALPSTEFLSHALFIAGWEPNVNLRRILNNTVSYAEQYYFNCENGITANVLRSANAIAEQVRVQNIINDGVGFINYTGHGNWNEWQGPRLNTTAINNLTNFNMYPVVISNACLTNNFNRSGSFGETLMRAEGRGAVAHIGASGSTFFDEDFQWAVGAVNTLPFNSDTITRQNTGTGVFDRIFSKKENEQAISLGQILFYGNMAVQLGNATWSNDMRKYYWEVYHLFGDPSFRPHFVNPNESKGPDDPINPPTAIQPTSDDSCVDIYLQNNGLLTVRILSETPSGATIQIKNIMGQNVATVVSNAPVNVGENNFYFNMNNLMRGAYICVIWDNRRRRISRKIVW